MTYYVSSGTLNLTKPKPKPMTLCPQVSGRGDRMNSCKCYGVYVENGGESVKATSQQHTTLR